MVKFFRSGNEYKLEETINAFLEVSNATIISVSYTIYARSGYPVTYVAMVAYNK